MWAHDPVRAFEVAKRMRTGSVAVNGGGPAPNFAGPFGGYKHSGLGREWGSAGLDEFLVDKAVTWSVRTG